MMPFDPYLNWLGIPVHEQPPNFYRLLGVVLFESQQQIIEQAADRQSLLVGSYQGGPQDELCQRLLSEIAMARFSLLDPQQKASYDSYLQESLAQRGERAVSAPPPPSTFTGAGQYGQPAQFGQPSQFGSPAQFGPPPAAGPMNSPMAMPPGPMPGSAPQFQTPAAMPQSMPMPAMPQSPMQQPMSMPAMPQMPMPVAMGPASMPMPQPMMRGGPQLMPAPAGFGPAMAPVPVAAAFPTATRASGNGSPTAAAAPPAVPPAAPQRPMDEIERLTSQPTSRRRFAKKKPTKDYTTEMVIGGIVAALGGLLAIVFWAVHSPAGYDAIDPQTSSLKHEALTSAAVEKARLEKEKLEKEKEKKKAAAVAADQHPQGSGLRKLPDRPKASHKNSKSSDDGEFTIKAPETQSGSRLRPIDAPDTNVAAPSPSTQEHDTPRDLGGDRDPVMELPQPDQKPDK